MRRLLCLFLALFLFLSSPLYVLGTEVTDPTVAPAPDLSETAIPVAVYADNAVAAALIGLGVQPGTSLDDFNQVVTDCVTALDDQGVFTDGKYAVIVNQEDGVTTMYAPVSLLDKVRTWLFDDSGVLIDNNIPLSPTVSYIWDGNSIFCSVNNYGTGYFCFVTFTTGPVGQIYKYFGTVASGSVSFSFRYFRNDVSVANVDVKPGVGALVDIKNFYIGSGSYNGDFVFSGLPMLDLGHLDSADDAAGIVAGMNLSDLGYLTDSDLSLGDVSDNGFYSWIENYSEYDGAAFVPMAVQSTYDQTIQTPQEYVQGGITDYTPPAPPDVTVPDWESPDVPQYPGSESAPPDNELLWGIRVAVSETIPYWIKTTAGSIVEWLQRIYNHITDTVAGLVGVLSTQHDALLAKLDELKSGFGGESSAGDELQSEVDRVDSELDEMTDIMNSVTRPGVDSIDTDISEHIDQANLTLLATPFTAMMTEGPFSTMVFIALTLVLCAYVLYGKR